MSSAIGSVGAYSSSLYSYNVQSNSTSTQNVGGTPPDPSDLFSKIDTNGDGSVSKDELVAFQKEMEKHAPKTGHAKDANKPDASQVFSQMDTNRDGKVSEEEFVAFFKSTQSQQSQASPYNKHGERSSGVTSSAVDALA